MDTMLSKALREFTTGPLNQLIVNLGSQDGDEWEQQLKLFLGKEPCWIPSQDQVMQALESQSPDLTSTGPTFGDWLRARERLHLFLTGEIVVLQNIFDISAELLARIDIMPIFRPAGATNRMALDWKVKLGMKPSYEEVDVMKYMNSQGLQVPELYYINRSIRPDEDTLGDNAKSPDQLTAIPNTTWTNLYGWSDADNVYFLITGNHLDSGNIWTWFPNDRLPDDRRVAHGYWSASDTQARFGWDYRSLCDPDIGARVAIPISLKP